MGALVFFPFAFYCPASTPDGKCAAAWQEKHCLHHGGMVDALAFSPDSKTLAAGVNSAKDPKLRLWDMQKGRERDFIEARGIRALKYSSDGMTLAVATGPSIFLWNLKERKKRAAFGGEAFVRHLDLSGDGRRLVVADWESGLRVWDIKALKVVAAFRRPNAFYGVAFAPDAKLIAVGIGHRPVVTNPGEVLLLDGEKAEVRRRLPWHGGEVQAVAFSPDGKLLAAGGLTNGVGGPPGGEIAVWDVKAGKELWSLQGHQGEVFAVAFAPDGKALASGATDGNVRLWAPATGRLLETIPARAGGVSSVAFSPDGNLLAAGGWDGTVRVWSRAAPK